MGQHRRRDVRRGSASPAGRPAAVAKDQAAAVKPDHLEDQAGRPREEADERQPAQIARRVLGAWLGGGSRGRHGWLEPVASACAQAERGTNARNRSGFSTVIVWIASSPTPASRNIGTNWVMVFAYPAPPLRVISLAAAKSDASSTLSR